MPADTLFIGFFVTLCLLGIVLAWIDIRDGIIPDWLNLTVAALGLAKPSLPAACWPASKPRLRAQPAD